MKLALSVIFGKDDHLIFAQQLGVDRVFVQVEKWDGATLSAARNRVEQTGLQVAGLEELPRALYARAIAEGDSAQIEQVCRLIGDIGAAGIPLVSYRWTPLGNTNGKYQVAGRGKASVPQFRAPAAPVVAAEKLWANLAHFLERVVPAAEKAGVRLACHPDVPPVPNTGILHDVASLRRLLALAPSPQHGLDLCVATVALMPGVDLLPTLGELASKAFAVHLANPRGTAAQFEEGFIDEGQVDLPKVLRALKQAGFAGALRAGAPPGMLGDTEWGHKGRAFDLGYLKAVLQVVG